MGRRTANCKLKHLKHSIKRMRNGIFLLIISSPWLDSIRFRKSCRTPVTSQSGSVKVLSAIELLWWPFHPLDGHPHFNGLQYANVKSPNRKRWMVKSFAFWKSMQKFNCCVLYFKLRNEPVRTDALAKNQPTCCNCQMDYTRRYQFRFCWKWNWVRIDRGKWLTGMC